MQLGYSWDKLTEAQLIGAAHDLRNAALVVTHAGHFQGALVNTLDGRVCMVGAIEIATYKTYHSTHPNLSGLYYYATGYDDAGAYRAEAAIVAASAMIPLSLCDDCDPERACACGCGNASEHEPWQIVTHYNDAHCVGDSLAINMMGLAAANAELFASKRKELVRA